MNQSHMQSETYMNDVEAAAYLGISRSWLTKLRVRGGGPPHVKLGRRCLYRRSDLDGFMRARLRRTTSEGRKLGGRFEIARKLQHQIPMRRITGRRACH